MSEIFSAVEEPMFATNWPRSSAYPRVWGLSITLQRLAYARIDVREGSVNIVFFPRAKALCLDEFRQLLDKAVFRYETWPKNREPLEDPDTEIHFEFTTEEWDQHKKGAPVALRQPRQDRRVRAKRPPS